MNSKLILSAIILTCVPLFVCAQNDEFNPLGRDIPAEELSKNLRIQLEWIEMKSTELIELLEEEQEIKNDGRLSANSGPLRDAVMDLVKDKDATFIETAIVNARSGQRAKVESITEYIYPTEYDPPGVILSEKGDNSSRLKSFTHLPQATAFETRNLGLTLEVDPVLGADNRTIDLNLAPELVYLVGQENYGTHVHEKSEVAVKMPTIYTLKTTTQITMIDGEYYFLGAQTPFNVKIGQPDRERKVLMFLKADIIYAGLPLAEDEGKKP